MAVCTWLLTLGLFGVVCGLLYLYLVWNFNSWKQRGIREAKSYPLVGSFPSSLTQKRHICYDMEEIYRTYKNDENFVGIIVGRSPQLFVLDPELIHNIFVNDFKSFHDNEFSRLIDEQKDGIVANNPFFLTGESWKERRSEITPGMTAVRIKNAYPVTLEVCKKFNKYIRDQIKIGTKEGINTIDLCQRFTSEVVTDSVLGIKAYSMTDNPTPILGMIKELFENSIIFMLYTLIQSIVPAITKIFKMRFIPLKVEKFFCNLMQQAIDLRSEQKNDRVDFLNYLLELKHKKQLSTTEVTSHALTFLLDGFITTALAIAHLLLLLARNPEIQEKLREEIMNNLDENGAISFEKLNELPYLDACFHEALRIFSPALFFNKLCTAPYNFTNKDGTTLSVNAGEVVMVSVNSLHHDEQFYEQPDKFLPERFMPENGGVKAYREKGVFLAFGDGPRICLGMRFALTQSKAATVEAVKNFNIKLNPKTRLDNMYDPKSMFGKLKGGIWLDFEAKD